MSDRLQETKALAKAYSVEFKDCGNGHIQLSAHGNLVNYYPDSKKRTLYSPTLDRRENHVSPWDAVRLCLSEAKKGMRPMKKKDIPKGQAQFSLKPVKANPAGLVHLYNGDAPPWEGSGFEFCAESDKLRHRARQLENGVIKLRAKADELDEAA